MNVRWLRYCYLAAFFFVCIAVQAFGQGCTQCLDSTRATPPEVQAAYRHTVYLLVAAASTLFLTATLLLRRNP